MRPRIFPYVAAFAVLMSFHPSVLFAQASATGPALTLSKARAIYYTPIDRGLQGFRCEVGFDWKNFIQKASNQPVADDDARLRYLQSIQLSIEDTLRGSGELHWIAATPPPDASEESIGKIREGMQQIWSGFFQSWNGFLTGDLLTLDARSVVEQNAGGYQVAVRTGSGLAEEQYDSSLRLLKVHVTTPTLDSIMTPTFAPSSQGLLVTGISSRYRQPPTAQPTEVTMDVNYAAVGSVQLPSALAVHVGSANFDFHLLNCTVKTQVSSR